MHAMHCMPACPRVPSFAPERQSLDVPQVRELAPGDFVSFRHLLLALDQPARILRFGAYTTDERLEAHAFHALRSATLMIGAFADGALRGALEIYRDDGGIAEAALVVERDHRGLGLGSKMLDGALDWAGRSQTQTLRLIFSRHNWGMRRLAHKVNARFDIVLGEICADLAIGTPSLAVTAGRRRSPFVRERPLRLGSRPTARFGNQSRVTPHDNP